MMRVYLAAPYAARALVKKYADELAQIGYEITSTWLDETHEINKGTVAAATDLADNQVDAHARQDMKDIDAADLFIAFTADAVTDALASIFGSSSGGRHVETGYALAKQKPVIVVGEPENVFHRLAVVKVCPNWHDAILEAAARLVRQERHADQAVAAG